MALTQRISALQKRHEWLDQILSTEMGFHSPDEQRVTQIKKAKLHVKDEIASLVAMQESLHAASFDSRYRRAG